jgi:hypothetical protein
MTVMSAALGFGQDKQEATPAKTAAAAEKKHAGGKVEPIKVHGHWVLEIRNPDGSLAQRKELENSLLVSAGGGQGALAQLLNGGVVVGGWAVLLYSHNTLGAAAIAQNAQDCARLSGIGSCGPTLTVSLSADTTQLFLQGTSAPVLSNDPITLVESYLLTCPAGTQSRTCITTGFAYGFSSALTSTNVQQGQTVTVTVTYSFS